MNFFVWLHLGTALLAATLALMVWRRVGAIGSRFFAYMMAGVTVWSLAYGLELASTTFPAMRGWLWVEYLGIATAPVCWLLFAIQYAGTPTRLVGRRGALLFVIPALTVVLNGTNSLHGLYYSRLTVDRSGPFPLLALSPGPWYWVHISYSLVLLVVGSTILLRLWRHTARPYRGQIAPVVIGAMVPIVMTLAYLSGLRPFGHIDLTPIALALTGALVGYSLLRHSLFDLAPVARTQLFAQLADAVVVLDLTERVVDLNVLAHRWLGVTIGQPLPPVLRVAQPGASHPAPLLLITDVRGRRPRTLEARRSPLVDHGGHNIGSIVVFQDVTARTALAKDREALIARLTAQTRALEEAVQARMAAEHALRTERDFALQVMQTMGEGLIVMDQEGRFTFVNDAYGKLTGYTPDELLGRSPYDLTVEDYRPALAAIAEARARGEASTYVAPLRHADGRVVEVQVTGTPRMLDGVAVGSVAVVTDLTAQRQAEAERLTLERQLFEAQRRDSIGTLAGGIAHDFNNLLMGVLGHAELLGLDHSADTPQGQSVQHIIAGAQRAAELTRQLLVYAGKGHFVIQPVIVNDLICSLGDLIRAAMPPSVHLGYELAPGLPLVMADATQLRQVVLNLLINGAEAMDPAGGEITLATRCAPHGPAGVAVAAGANPPASWVQVQVRDTGCGMNAATQARMFEPFFSTKFPGRGLGLAAVQGIVREHGGAMEVISATGAGTTVDVWLPAAEAPSMVSPPKEQHYEAARAVLVIDDEEAVRTVAQRMLERLGLRVVTAADGAAALATLASPAADISMVIVDLTMPTMSGAAVTREILARYPDMQVIVMSGYSADEVERQLGPLSLAGKLQKPFTLQALRACLAALEPADALA